MHAGIEDLRGHGLIGQQNELELVQAGFQFIEGPVWSAEDNSLIFSDIPADQMWRWSQARGLTSFRQPSRKANGNTFDLDGRLITCEHATSRVVRAEPDGTITVLAERWQGKELNSPNDVIVGPDGTVYFTDPTYGRSPGFGVPRPPELSFRGVYQITTDGALELLADDFVQPNGLCLSSDGSTLYVNDTDRMHIRVFDVKGGRVSGGAEWARTVGEGEGKPDGMKLDQAGNLWCTGPGGLHVFDPGAQPVGVLPVPETAANFAWGGTEADLLFVCASTGLYRIRTQIHGRPFHRRAS